MLENFKNMISEYFTTFPPKARLWIFMGEQSFSPEEEEFIDEKLNNFLPEWNAHGKEMKAEFKILYHQFIILVADESFSVASGCSIDSLTRVFKSLEQDLNLKLTNRMLIPFKANDQIETLTLKAFSQAVKNKEISSETIVFDNSVANLQDFQQKWKLPLVQSWAKKFL